MKLVFNFICLFLLSVYSSMSLALQDCTDADINFRGKVRSIVYLSLEDCSKPWKEQSVMLRFTYSENINSWFFRKAAKHILKRNLSKQQWSTHKPLFTQIDQAYETIEQNDEYRIAYDIVNQTLRLDKNGSNLITLKDSDAQLYFLIWFGDKPMDDGVKARLLAGV